MSKPSGIIGLHPTVLNKLRTLGFESIPGSHQVYDNGLNVIFEREFILVKDDCSFKVVFATDDDTGKVTLVLQDGNDESSDFSKPLLRVEGKTDKQIKNMLARLTKTIA